MSIDRLITRTWDYVDARTAYLAQPNAETYAARIAVMKELADEIHDECECLIDLAHVMHEQWGRPVPPVARGEAGD